MKANIPEHLQTTLQPEHLQSAPEHLQASPQRQPSPLHPVPQIHTFAKRKYINTIHFDIFNNHANKN